MLVEQKTTYNLTVTIPELRLILKALDGRLNSIETNETEEAKKLGILLSYQKAKLILQLSKENDKLIENLKKSGEWRE